MYCEDITIRWAIRRDIPIIAAIERELFTNPWTEKRLVEYLRERDHYGWVAIADDEVVGYMMCRRNCGCMELDAIVVDTDYRREGIATCLLAGLRQRMLKTGDKTIETIVMETNLPTIRFLQRSGFLAVGTVRRPMDTDEDGYRMQYSMVPTAARLKNRITRR